MRYNDKILPIRWEKKTFVIPGYTYLGKVPRHDCEVDVTWHSEAGDIMIFVYNTKDDNDVPGCIEMYGFVGEYGAKLVLELMMIINKEYRKGTCIDYMIPALPEDPLNLEDEEYLNIIGYGGVTI